MYTTKQKVAWKKVFRKDGNQYVQITKYKNEKFKIDLALRQLITFINLLQSITEKFKLIKKCETSVGCSD